MGLFKITRWPAILVFLLAGLVAMLFAFVTVNLFTQAMSSLAFLREFRGEAIRHGALWQVGELLLSGSVALGCWLVFKLCEHELTERYLDWSGRERQRRNRKRERR